MALVVYTGQQNQNLNLNLTDPTHDIIQNIDTPSFVGLSNQGATCYLNSLLQTLFMTPEFRKAIFSWKYDKEKYGDEEFCIPLQLQRLFGLLALGKNKTVDTVALTKSFGWEGSEVFQQQDVQELTRVLFDTLEETFKGTTLEHDIDEMYSGELIDYIRCIDVDYQSERQDKFLDLSFAIIPFGQTKAMHSLSECIEMFLRPEILDGENQYFVESVGKKVDAIKGLKFGKLPHIMSCNLKRFVYDFSSDYVTQKKLNDIVKFPMILDMNRYVCRRRKSYNNMTTGATKLLINRVETDDMDKSDHDDNKIIEDEYEANVEFEEFLLQQMNSLRRSNSNKLKDDPSLEPQTKKVTLNPFDDEDDMQSDYPDLPDLVDYAGKKCPEQIQEEKQQQAIQSMFKCDWTDDEIISLIEERGEWVYELFAVLIHSGAIAGGHYYAYIKDIDNQKWYNFNDSSVTPINVDQVTEAWGKKQPVYNTSSSNYPYYGAQLYPTSSSSSNLTLKPTEYNSANAYMLMYRKIDLNSFKLNPKPKLFPGVESIPDYIINEVKIMEEKQQARLREREEMKNKIDIKIIWKANEHIISMNKHSTYHELLLKLWEVFDMSKEPEFQVTDDNIHIISNEGESLDSMDIAVLSSEQSGSNFIDNSSEFNKIHSIEDSVESGGQSVEIIDQPSHLSENVESIDNDVDSSRFSYLSRMRLRIYYVYNQSAGYPYDYDKNKNLTLEVLCFSSHRTLLLETRSPNDEFEVYYELGINISVDEYEDETNTFKLTKIYRLPSNGTSLQLYEIVAKSHKSTINDICLMKTSVIGYYDVKFDLIIRSSQSRLRDDLFISDYVKVILQNYPYPTDPTIFDLEILPSVISYRNNKAALLIRFNIFPSRETNTTISGDYRWTVGELRSHIAGKCNLPVESTRLMRGSFNGMDLKDDSRRLHQEGFYHNITICVLNGKTVPIGYYNISMSLFNPLTYKSKAYFLPVATSLDEKHNDYDRTNLNYKVSGQLVHRISPQEDLQHSDNVDSNISNSNEMVTSNDQKENNNEFSLPPIQALNVVPLVDGETDNDEDDEYFNDCENSNVTSTPILEDSNYDVPSVNLFETSDSKRENVKAESFIILQTVPPNEIDPWESVDQLERNRLFPESYDEITDVSNIKMPKPSNIHLNGHRNTKISSESVIEEIMSTPAPDLKKRFTAVLSDVKATKHTVEPNDFAERKTNVTTYNKNFEALPELEEIYASENSLVRDMKEEIIQRLISSGRVPSTYTYQHIRLRDKVYLKPDKILYDHLTLKQNGIRIYEAKALCIQILEEPEELVKYSEYKDKSKDSIESKSDYVTRIIQEGDNDGYDDDDDILPDIAIDLENISSSSDIHQPESRESDDILMNPTDSSISEHNKLNFSEFIEGDTLILVQRWYRSTWSLGECREVYLKGYMTIQEIALGLSQMFSIPPQSLRALIVHNHSDVHLRHLHNHHPKGANEPWFNPVKETMKLSELTRLSFSDMLLLQDISEPLYEIGPSDLLSIQLVELAEISTNRSLYNYDDNYGGMYANYNFNNYNSNVKSSTSNQSQSNGIKIKIHRNNSNPSVSEKSSMSATVSNDILAENTSSTDKERDTRKVLFSDIC